MAALVRIVSEYQPRVKPEFSRTPRCLPGKCMWQLLVAAVLSGLPQLWCKCGSGAGQATPGMPLLTVFVAVMVMGLMVAGR